MCVCYVVVDGYDVLDVVDVDIMFMFVIYSVLDGSKEVVVLEKL